MTTFKAGVQYGDWEGTAAADNADHVHGALSKYLSDNNLIQQNEFLIAHTLWIGENHGRLGSVSISVFLYTIAGAARYDTVKDELDALQGPIPVREVTLNLTIEQYIVLFKRFNVMFTNKGLNLEGREFRA